MAITEKQIISDIESGHPTPVYLLMGEEDYYIDRLSDYFETRIISTDATDFDLNVLYSLDYTMEQVVATCRQCPVLSPHRVVILKEAQNKTRTKEWEALSAYLVNPSPTTILVICYRHKTMDKRTKFYKDLARTATVYEAPRIRESQVPEWVLQHVTDHGYRITQPAALLMAEHLGNNLQNIAGELAKLYITLPSGSIITEDILQQNVGINKEYNVFELQNAIARRDHARCARIVASFAQNPKSNPIQPIIALLYKFCIATMIYIQAPDKADPTLPERMGVSRFALRDYAVAAQNYTLGRLATCVHYLHQADLRSKGVQNNGATTDGQLLKELIFKITH